MKNIINFLIVAILIPFGMNAQLVTWEVKAFPKNGNEIPVNAYFEDGSIIPVTAILKDGDDHFMDVKLIFNNKELPIKLIASNDVYVPVKGITPEGKLINIKADFNGTLLDVKGVSRNGNIINIAAVDDDNKFWPIRAISPKGVTRDVQGIKFLTENVELEINGVSVIAHVKALPAADIKEVESKWSINAETMNGEMLELVCFNEKGKEYQIKANMEGSSANFMNVRGVSGTEIMIKLVKTDKKIIVQGIDEFGRLYRVEAKAKNGKLLSVYGGERTGNVIPIFVLDDDNNKLPVVAISSKGNKFDVHGLKVTNEEVEGIISGLNVWIRYYAHVKALAPINNKEFVN